MVASYLRENPGTTIQVLSDETKVSIALIRHFIIIGRIITTQFQNLSYPCETCGNMIKTGKICSTCREKINLLTTNDENSNNNSDEKLAGGYITRYL